MKRDFNLKLRSFEERLQHAKANASQLTVVVKNPQAKLRYCMMFVQNFLQRKFTGMWLWCPIVIVTVPLVEAPLESLIYS